MQIDRNRGLTAFEQYVSPYDITDEKIRLKVDHTYRVADICAQIAESISLSQEDIDLAWLMGLLHDVGRFEQVRRFQTFMDAESVDHAEYGADILFSKACDELQEDAFTRIHPPKRIRDYVENKEEDELIEKAIRNHNKFEIEEGLTVREIQFCNILRDADKVDILKVNVESPIEEIYNQSIDEFKHSMVTKEVMENFLTTEGTVLKNLKKTAIDHVVGHISLVFGMIYKKSLELTKEQGFLEQLLQFPTENEATKKQFKQLQEKMHAYMQNKLRQ